MADKTRRTKQFILGFLEKLERYEKYIESDLPTAKLKAVELRLNDLIDSYNHFIKSLPPYEKIDETEITPEIIKNVEEAYFFIRPELEERIQEIREAKLINQNADKEKPVQPVNVKLPDISLDLFYGDYMNWPNFIGSFDSLVHNNASLSDISRFQYLKRSLKGAAAQAIESLDFTPENYLVARDLLQERFNKPVFICEQHIKSIFTYKSIDRPCPKRIIELIDHFKSHLRSLESLGRPVNRWDDLIVFTMVSKLDSDTKSKWIDASPASRLPTVEDLYEFLRSRAYKLENQVKCTLPLSTTHNSSPKPVVRPIRSSSNILAASKSTYHCVHCKVNGHSIGRCHKFLSLPIARRQKYVADSNLCNNCLKTGHVFDACPMVDRCRHCQQAHHSLLHDSSSVINSSNIRTRSDPCTSSNTESPSSSSLIVAKPRLTNPSFVYLATALVHVLDKYGHPVVGRALLDSGSQLNFVTSSFWSKLKLPTNPSSVLIHGIGSNTMSSKSNGNITLMSCDTNFSSTLDVQILPSITGYQPSLKINTVANWRIPANIKLADPTFDVPRPIDLLIGAELYYELLSVGQIKLGDDLPVLQNTVLGWIVSGRCSTSQTTSTCHLIVGNQLNDLSDQIEKFWITENVPSTINMRSSEELSCEEHFVKNTVRDDTGRFVVKMPFFNDPLSLGDSKALATRRFFNLEKRLHKSPELLTAYSAFLKEYQLLGHMNLVDPDSIASPNFYFPHHCVIKQDSSTTKLRVVFDGSAKTTSGVSLNSIMMVGPTVQSDLFSILIRFRSHVYAFSADIEKMYRQIRVSEEDHQFQYILWRNGPGEKLCTYKLNTVTYGTSSAPFLATRCLNQLSQDFQSELPTASEAIGKDVYVDDLLTGARTLSDAKKLKFDVQKILKTAGMDLRKWCSNSSSIISDIPSEHREKMLKIDDNDLIKTLGILWQPSSDVFVISLNLSITARVTKRNIFSQIARIYDPLGFLSPVVILGKLMIQSLWKLQLDWDQSIPQHLHTQWLNFHDSLVELNKFSIKRFIFNSADTTNIEIHGFADASERAYGAVLYVRSTSADGQVNVSLLCSKSRVAPLKSITIPKLELCAANLLADLTHKIMQIINFRVNNYYYWSDSTITLQWIKGCPSKWKTFVSNRVASIKQLTTSDSWLHVPSELNPADLVSRGVVPEKFVSSGLWKNGPDFLLLDRSSWPSQSYKSTSTDLELATSTVHLTNVKPNDDILATIKWNRDFLILQRVVAYMLRLKPQPKYRGHLKLAELTRAHQTIVRVVQRHCFPEEYHGLSKSKFVVKHQLLKSLNLFLDDDRIIRVGGRLQHSTLSYESKHPILLPSNHDFTLTILLFYHRKYHHVGPQALLAAVRDSYWPIHGKKLCTKIFRQCIQCFRVRPTKITQQMGNLPVDRVTPSPPFYSVGVDYCGPFFIHYRLRGKQPTKTYMCVFICFVTKAVHLELASDLSTQSFLGALKRFVATRGLPKRIYSDNGTNFIGANSTLRELYELLQSKQMDDQLQTYCQSQQIEWKFTPPCSPNFGGLHEAGVKLAKFHLRRTIGTAKCTHEQLATVMKDAEAILNSRPLTPLSSDPHDMQCLTPGHLLIGRPLTSLPLPNLSDRPPLDVWKHVDHIKNTFWQKWSTEYLRAQQQRHQWTSSTPNIAINDLVVLIEDNLPPLKWKLGRIVETYPGEDGLVRVVKVKTAQGEYKRGICKICKLPESVETGLTFQGGQNDESPDSS